MSTLYHNEPSPVTFGWIYGYGQHFHDMANMYDPECPAYGTEPGDPQPDVWLEWLFRNESHQCVREGDRRGEWRP